MGFLLNWGYSALTIKLMSRGFFTPNRSTDFKASAITHGVIFGIVTVQQLSSLVVKAASLPW